MGHFAEIVICDLQETTDGITSHVEKILFADETYISWQSDKMPKAEYRGRAHQTIYYKQTGQIVEEDNYDAKYMVKKIKYGIISENLKKLMNFEGRIAQIYLDQFKKLVIELAPEFKFVGRMNKSNSWNANASDEINALLNYGYAILESEVRKSLNSVGLDPTIGFLHELYYSKTPLVYDFQELFRWIIDYSIIQLLDSRPKFKKSDFIVTENYNIRLKESTAKALILKIKNNFNLKTPFKGKNYTYENVLFYKIQDFANLIADKNNKIDFKIPEFKIKNEDTLDFKGKILKMTPDERKKLGINKSTLWYMKKNIQDGKKVKFYDKNLSKFKN